MNKNNNHENLTSMEKIELIIAMKLFMALMNEEMGPSKRDLNMSVLDMIDKERAEGDMFDRGVKKVGDIVKFPSELGSGYMWDKDTLTNYKPSKTDRLAFMEKEAIVIETGCDKQLLCSHCDHPHLADVLICFRDSKKEFYVMSENIRVVNGS